MPLSLRYLVLLVVILSTLLPEAYAQRRRKPRIWEGFSVTGRVGANHFFGDLVDDGRTNVSLGFVAEKELSVSFAARSSIMLGAMSGTQFVNSSGDKTDNNTYAYFDNMYTEFNIGGTFKPLNEILGYFRQRSFNPYIVGQIGAVYYNATENYGAGSGRPHGEEWRKKSGISATIAGGMGLSYWVNSQWSVNIEAIGTLPFTDELDAHSEWTNGIGEVIQTDARDFYYTTSIGLTYIINDSRWKNEPKYNRKAYLKTRSQMRRPHRSNLKSISKKRRRR